MIFTTHKALKLFYRNRIYEHKCLDYQEILSGLQRPRWLLSQRIYSSSNQVCLTTAEKPH